MGPQSGPAFPISETYSQMKQNANLEIEANPIDGVPVLRSEKSRLLRMGFKSLAVNPPVLAATSG